LTSNYYVKQTSLFQMMFAMTW